MPSESSTKSVTCVGFLPTILAALAAASSPAVGLLAPLAAPVIHDGSTRFGFDVAGLATSVAAGGPAAAVVGGGEAAPRRPAAACDSSADTLCVVLLLPPLLERARGCSSPPGEAALLPFARSRAVPPPPAW